MRATISLDSLWAIIQSLSFNNRKWLSDKLQESLREEETEYISKEEILTGIDAGLKDLKLIREGKLDVMSAEEFLEELEDY
ncbi:MAG TPA: surface protein [Candidatus Bacteroides merdigallinarum]|uniref:Surface protein n=1 Tax=Candidatus Bacteroides merdigallinarum TaxID=2838473 RepID=A0A9D2E9E1_9BACE|nr:surface protein [Candidatus Bacteroides merdigallinarum]